MGRRNCSPDMTSVAKLLFAWNVTWILLCVSRDSDALSYNDVNAADQEAKVQIDISSNYIYGPPILKMLKRQVRNFRTGHRATVTLVYQANQPVSVRWYRLDPGFSLRGTEIPNTVPVEGDPEYKVSSMSSGDVRATTLTISRLRETTPRSFETILTNGAGTMHYQLRTVVKKSPRYLLDHIDSPEWMIIPPTEKTFRKGGPLNVDCRIFVPKEKHGYTNELSMSRLVPILNDTDDPRFAFESVLAIHKDTQKQYAEEHGPTISERRRYPMHKGHVVYEIKMHTTNALLSFEGVYQCVLERKFDKTIVISSVTLLGNVSVFPATPRADLVPCERTDEERHDHHIVLRQGHVSCVRCRGFGHPRPEVGVYRYGQLSVFRTPTEVTQSSYVSVSKYINVADAGVAESTYTFRRPDPTMSGRYACVAKNSGGQHDVYFEVDYRAN